jgi:hypothetical protein
MAVECFFGEVTIDSNNSGITVNGSSGDLTHGIYYVHHPLEYKNDEYQSYLGELAHTMSGLAGFTINYTMSSVGVVSLSGSQSFSIADWDSYNVPGFTCDSQSAATAHVASKYCMYTWFPEREASKSLAPLSRKGARKGFTTQTTAVDGTTYSAYFGTTTVQSLTYQYLSKARTWNGNYDNQSLEEFYISTFGLGHKIVFMPDESDDSEYWEYNPDLKETSDFKPKRQLIGSDLYWETTLPFGLLSVQVSVELLY